MKCEWSRTDDTNELNSPGLHGLIHSMDLVKNTYIPIASVVLSGKRNRVTYSDVIDTTFDAKANFHPDVLSFVRKLVPVISTKGFVYSAKSNTLLSSAYDNYDLDYDYGKSLGSDDKYKKDLKAVLEHLEYLSLFKDRESPKTEEIYDDICMILGYSLETLDTDLI